MNENLPVFPKPSEFVPVWTLVCGLTNFQFCWRFQMCAICEQLYGTSSDFSEQKQLVDLSCEIFPNCAD